MVVELVVEVHHRVGGRYAEVGAHFEVVHRIDRHRRADLHTVFELVGLFGVKLVRVVVVCLDLVLCVVEIHPRPVDAELDHAGQRILVQVVGFTPDDRRTEVAFQFAAAEFVPPVDVGREFLVDVIQVEILGTVFPDRAVAFRCFGLLYAGRNVTERLIQRVQFLLRDFLRRCGDSPPPCRR